MDPDRLPPWDREAERAVLGSMLRDNRCVPDVAALLRPEDFHADAHQAVCAAVLALSEAGKPADLVTVATELGRVARIADVGYAYLAELWDAAPSAANVLHYAATVKDRSLCRRLIRAGAEVVRDAYDRSGPAEELLAEAERKVMALSQLGACGQAVGIGEAVGEACEHYDRVAAGEVTDAGLPTGWADLDRMLAGLHPGELVIVGARPSTGKTALALGLLRHVAGEGVPAYFVSLEQSRRQVATRMLASEARVNGHKLRRVTCDPGELGRVAEARARLKALPLKIDDTPAQTISRVSANARRMRQRHGAGLVVIDYLQLIEPENRRESREQQVALISRRLKQLARDLSVPVVVLAQLNRVAETRDRPRLCDLRESGSQEQDADVVLLLHRPELNNPGERVNQVDVIVAKQRDGPTGDITLCFVAEHVRFENFASWEDDAAPVGGNAHHEWAR